MEGKRLSDDVGIWKKHPRRQSRFKDSEQEVNLALRQEREEVSVATPEGEECGPRCLERVSQITPGLEALGFNLK